VVFLSTFVRRALTRRDLLPAAFSEPGAGPPRHLAMRQKFPTDPELASDAPWYMLDPWEQTSDPG